MKVSIETILDTGPLVAWLCQADQHHAWCSRIFSKLPLPVVTCESVIAEAAHRLRKYGSGVESLCQLLESGELKIETIADLPAAASFMRKYETDFADASVVWLSEQHPRAKVFTVDFKDFTVYRRFKNQMIPLVEVDPENWTGRIVDRNSKKRSTCPRREECTVRSSRPALRLKS
ncbi:MAG: PIN domain-containing protein [Bryobacterales bacterium]|nr:PIN domain-containing protein [Opitutaceae bacterium]MCZ2154834.1 PIN domain-containing protein [Bryobacterales bacterium]